MTSGYKGEEKLCPISKCEQSGRGPRSAFHAEKSEKFFKASKTDVSAVSAVEPRFVQNTEHFPEAISQNKQFLALLRRPRHRTGDCWSDTEAIEPKDLEPRRNELDRNLGTDPYQIQERFMKSYLTEDMDEFGKVGAEVSYLQSQMHSDYDSAGSIADSDLEDGELQVVAVDWIFSSRIKFVGLEPVFGSCQWRVASGSRAALDIFWEGLLASRVS